MASPRPIDTGRSLRWSLYAGVYMFLCATATALLLSDILTVLADVIRLPTDYWMLTLASPALAIGAVVWWAVVERREAQTYVRGVAFGLLTALLTGLVWTVQFIQYWGIEMVLTPIAATLIGIVLGLVAVAGVITGIPIMSARRYVNGELSREMEDSI